jgi:tRNA(fMet)-specific endonuclease VapC
MPTYLLDTNILVRYVRQDPVWSRINRTFGLFLADPLPVYSVVTAGELRSLAIQFGWGPAKLDQMEFILSYFRQMSISASGIVQAYADIDAATIDLGHSLGKNDLWIAASAAATQATLLTTDRDFDRIPAPYLSRIYIDPSAP